MQKITASLNSKDWEMQKAQQEAQDSEHSPKLIWDWLDVSKQQEDDFFVP